MFSPSLSSSSLPYSPLMWQLLAPVSASPCACFGADLMHVLWEADVAVFKAHITTGPSDKVLDLFWIYDNKKELPENHRLASSIDKEPAVSSCTIVSCLTQQPLALLHVQQTNMRQLHQCISQLLACSLLCCTMSNIAVLHVGCHPIMLHA